MEVPFTVSRRDLTVASFGSLIPVPLPRKGRLRARFCASGMDAAQDVDTVTSDLPTIDRYLVALWPAPETEHYCSTFLAGGTTLNRTPLYGLRRM